MPDVKEDVITELICPVCNKVTKVPKNNFMNNVSEAKHKATTGAQKAYYAVTGKPTANCPICNTANIIAAPQVAEANAAQPSVASGEANHPVRVEVNCKKCDSSYPALFQPKKD
jgi:cytochrome c5